VNMACAGRAPGDIKSRQHLLLEPRSEALNSAQPVSLYGSFKLVQGRDAKFTIELQDLLGAKTRNGQHLEHARRDIAAQFLKT
jgi:hypothetical protein